MKLKNIISILVIIIFMGIAGIVVYGATGQNTVQENTISFDSRTITRNVWGAPPEEQLTCEIYLNKEKTYGWQWDRSDPQKNPGDTFVRPIFPNVRIGADFGVKSNSRYFPIKLRDIRNLTLAADYWYLTEPTEAYNLAYQMYFSDIKSPKSDKQPLAEVMIWVHRTFTQPPNTHQGDFSDGAATYALYAWRNNNGSLYTSFIMKGEPVFKAQYAVDAKKLLDVLILDPDWYLLGVHLGNEIVSGVGKIEIDKFAVNLNGKQL